MTVLSLYNDLCMVAAHHYCICRCISCVLAYTTDLSRSYYQKSYCINWSHENRFRRLSFIRPLSRSAIDINVYIFFWCPFVFWVWTRRSALSKIAMLPNEMAPLTTIVVQTITVIFFILLYAFFLTSTFRIICFVFFIIVYFFNTVFYYKPFSFAWVIQ